MAKTPMKAGKSPKGFTPFKAGKFPPKKPGVSGDAPKSRKALEPKKKK